MADNAARLAALAALGVGAPAGVEGPAPVTLTGRTVYAGGDVERTLTATVALGYVDDAGLRWYPRDGQPGDVVTVTAEQAERLDSLGATLLDDSEDSAPDQLDALDAAALVELAGTSEEARERVFAYESGRAPSAQRKTVLEASAPTSGDEDDEQA